MSDQLAVSSSLAPYVSNETDKKGAEILRILTTNIPGFVKGFYGFRPVGSNDVPFPCVMVEPIKQQPSMVTTGKWQLLLSYYIYFYVVESQIDSLVRQQTFTAEAIIELFTNRFYKTNAGFWINSEMTSMDLSGSFLNAKTQTAQYMRAGILRLDVLDVVAK